MRLAHISDPHLSELCGVQWWKLPIKRQLSYLSWYRRRRHEHRREILDDLLTDLRTQDIDHLAITGDLTHLGLEQEQRQATEWLEQLQDLVYTLIPGNHDALVAERQRGMPPWHRGGSGFPHLERRGEVAIISLDSAVPTPPLLATGRLGEAQRSALAEQLQATRGMFRCVLIHHPPLPGITSRRKALTDDAAVAEVLATEGAELVLHGHIHRARITQLPLTGGGELPVVGAPSASARGGRAHDEPAGYWLFDPERGADGSWSVVAALRRMVGPGDFRTVQRYRWSCGQTDRQPGHRSGRHGA